MSDEYEVLSPWADVDPVPLRGISPRPPDLTDKTIGLFVNFKRVAASIQAAVERQLGVTFPTLKFSRFAFDESNLEVAETADQARFAQWVKGLDAVITAVGD
ncbi:MAG: hypothetical protein HY675_24220 [Chloroflexi bacterium]|nr:hypothetical protein [Chloroflexota bacterium]